MSRFIVQLNRSEKATVSDVGVYLPNASTIGFAKSTAKRGDLLVWDGRLVRSLGRIESVESPDANRWRALTGKILGLTLADSGTFAYIRVLDPADVTECNTVPSDFASFFFSPTLPTPDLTVWLADYGTLSHDHIRGIQERIRQFKSGERI